MNSVTPPRAVRRLSDRPVDEAIDEALHPGKKRTRLKQPGPPPGVTYLSDVRESQQHWLWQGWLPLGALVMIDGDPGVGKSTLAVDFAARVTTGRPWPDGSKCPRGEVLLMTAEEGLAQTVRPKLLAAGGDPAKVAVLAEIQTSDGTRLPSLPLDVPFIESIIKPRHMRLMIVDVLASYLGGETRINSHQDTEVRRALYPLFQMAERTGCCVVMLRHLNKQDGSNPMYRGGGSIGIAGQARAVHLAAYDPDDSTQTRRILAAVKVNNAKMPPAISYSIVEAEGAKVQRVEWGETSPHSAQALLSAPLGEDERHDRDHAVTFLQEYLSRTDDGEAPKRAIVQAAKEIGINEQALKRARRRAKVEYRRVGYQTGSVWALDADVFSAMKAARESESVAHSDHLDQLPAPDPNDPNGELAQPPSFRPGSPAPAKDVDPGQAPVQTPG